MLRYFATKWASILLGTGTFFVALGLIIFADGSLILPAIPAITTVLPFPVVAMRQDLWEVPFSLVFYGGLQMAIGISVLLLQRFRRLESRDVILMNHLD